MSKLSSRETLLSLVCVFILFLLVSFCPRTNAIILSSASESNVSTAERSGEPLSQASLQLRSQEELENLQTISYVGTTPSTEDVHNFFPNFSQLVLDNSDLDANTNEWSLSMLDQSESQPVAADETAARIALHEESLKLAEKPQETKPAADDVKAQDAPGRWTRERASQWQKDNGWLVGSNFLPANAINQLEMWQKDTFDKQQIDKELGWAESLGMNTMRVFLHDLVWQDDAEGFKKRIDEFLTIADKHHIKPVFVLFDSCWDPEPKLGKQREPQTGVHNSGWVQSPGRTGLTDPSQKQRLESYVKGVVAAFANDPRILMWDVWNEPDNLNPDAYKAKEPGNKIALVQDLLPQVFQWARSANPSQPMTSGVWLGDWSSFSKLNPIQKAQLENSDVISFHNYGTPQDFEQRTKWLSQYDRPQLCTEYMARPMKSTFDPTLEIAKKNNVGMINWGFVAGKSQTYYPWDSWKKPYPQPYNGQWFHDIFRQDGTPYNAAEVDYIRRLTGVTKPQAQSTGTGNRGWFTQFLTAEPARI